MLCLHKHIMKSHFLQLHVRCNDSKVAMPARERADVEERLKTSLSRSVRDKNGPGYYYYDFNAADYRCKSRSCNALSRLSAPPIGTVIDSSVFMRIDVAAAWRTISSSSSWNCCRSGKERKREKAEREQKGEEREMTHASKRDMPSYIWASSHFRAVSSFRRDAIDGHDRFKATDVTTGPS